LRFVIEASGEAAHGPCADCGHETRSVWGYVSNVRGARGVLHAVDRRPPRARRAGARDDRPLGWRGSEAASAFGLELRVLETGPSFMLVDAATLPWTDNAIVGTTLTREAALGHPMRDEVFAILDQVIVEDPRVERFLVG
jgi:hypothetical protein